MSTNDELACTYAALILADDNIEVTVDKINTLLKAAKVRVKPFWPSLFVRVLSHRNVDELILSAGGGAPAAGGAAPVAAAGGAPAAAAAPAAEKAPEKAPEPAEESDDDMGFGLFD